MTWEMAGTWYVNSNQRLGVLITHNKISPDACCHECAIEQRIRVYQDSYDVSIVTVSLRTEYMGEPVRGFRVLSVCDALRPSGRIWIGPDGVRLIRTMFSLPIRHSQNGGDRPVEWGKAVV